MDLSSPATELQNGFLILQKLQYLQDRVFPLTALLESSASTIGVLQASENRYRKLDSDASNIAPEEVDWSDVFRSYEIQLQAHLLSVEVLKNRIKGSLRLVSPDSLTLYDWKI